MLNVCTVCVCVWSQTRHTSLVRLKGRAARTHRASLVHSHGRQTHWLWQSPLGCLLLFLFSLNRFSSFFHLSQTLPGEVTVSVSAIKNGCTGIHVLWCVWLCVCVAVSGCVCVAVSGCVCVAVSSVSGCCLIPWLRCASEQLRAWERGGEKGKALIN